MLSLRIYRQRILVLILISSMVSAILGIASTSVHYASLSTALVRAFYFANDPYTFFALALTMLPFILLVYTLSGMFVQDIDIYLIYCFTRKSNFLSWYFKSTVRLALMSLLCTLIYSVVGMAIVILRNEATAAQIAAAFPHFMLTFLLAWLFVFGSSFLMNTFSLIIQPKYILPVYVAAVIAFCGALSYSLQNNYRTLAFLNPITHFNYPLHCESFSIPDTEFFSSILPELHIYQSIVFFVVIIVLTGIAGITILKKTDIGLQLED